MYFVMTTGQTFSEKIGRVVTSPEACLLDWPITDLGRDQIKEGVNSLQDLRTQVWPLWKRRNKLAILASGQNDERVGLMSFLFIHLDLLLKLAHKMMKTTFIGWKLLRNKQKMVPRRGDCQKPEQIVCRVQSSSDFKSAKQTTTYLLPMFLVCKELLTLTESVVCDLLSRDETVSDINVQHTKLLRERYLGAKRELGGYDNCIMYDFQIHALDMLDSSHSLGGVESCEKALSRFLQLVLEIELSISEKQAKKLRPSLDDTETCLFAKIVLITHVQMAKIILTVFANVQPGLHQELPDLENGGVTELKFSSSRGAAVLDEPEDQDDGEGKAPQRKAERSLRIYLSVSAGRDRERDVVLEEVIPKIFEKCSRRSIAVSYVDNRHSWDELDEDTIHDRLDTLKTCNVLICIMDPVQESRSGLSSTALMQMSLTELSRSFFALVQSHNPFMPTISNVKTLDEALQEFVAAECKSASDLERRKLLTQNPHALRYEIDKAERSATDAVVKEMNQKLPGLLEFQSIMRYIRSAVNFESEMPEEEVEEKLISLTKKYFEEEMEEIERRKMLRSLFWLGSIFQSTQDKPSFLIQISKNLSFQRSLHKAAEKYPWATMWFDATLLGLEMRLATLSRFLKIGCQDRQDETPGWQVKMMLAQLFDFFRSPEVNDSLDDLVKLGVQPTDYEDPHEVVDALLVDMETLLNNMFPVEDVLESMFEDKLWHDEIAKSKSSGIVMSSRVSTVIRSHLEGNSKVLMSEEVYNSMEDVNRGLIVVGTPGSGKSSALAVAGLSHRLSQPDDVVILHFANSSAKSRDPWRVRECSRRLTLEVSGEESRHVLGKSTRDVNHVVECFYLAMEKSHLSRGGRSNVAVLLDGIDMMDESETNFDIWLPLYFPSTIRFVLSCPVENQELADYSLVDVDDGGSHGRVLADVEEAAHANAIIRELKRSRDVQEVYHNMLCELERNMGDDVKHSLCLLCVSQRGLQEHELYELLRLEGNSSYLWLYKFLRAMKEIIVPICGYLKFFHALFQSAVENKYFKDADTRLSYHKRLEVYFRRRPVHFKRKMEEFPFQLSQLIMRRREMLAAKEEGEEGGRPKAEEGTVARKPIKFRSAVEGLVFVHRLKKHSKVNPKQLPLQDDLWTEQDLLESYLLVPGVLRGFSTALFHADLCAYWKVICSTPGSLATVSDKYIGSFQQYVYETGDKGLLPFLLFSAGFLLEDLDQFRPASKVYIECLRSIEHLQLLHPLLLNALKYGRNLLLLLLLLPLSLLLLLLLLLLVLVLLLLLLVLLLLLIIIMNFS
ncbi:hypothetical protein GUITHDRAFT_104581 [Guillardia theta CCMP2712]|uniref:NACHT domain-containing protein n=1 Tax=Guillardia theta (strain CCMP2712) TaxID=905079 RepID=L1JM16_GUITC|nr:hypothetical protein GUITHDRAFT_104581 [Guillardia theta CCMP2712]EKX49621.1 hypothetical protein GUITHDRAFT_104581 [Guillardia theta CCMP2712]|eukprot:XP_005836601.1 hypothetical protein GUITHDRAFT_104581 [Guillardia theta CCMP2712]